MNYTLPTLKTPKNGDWYIYYSYRDPATGDLLPFKVRDGINRIKEKKSKVEYGKNIVHDYTKLLKTGWSPLPSTVKAPYEGETLLEIFDKFHEIQKKASLEETTVKAYKYGLKNLRDFLEDMKMADIKPEDFKGSMANSFSEYLFAHKNFSIKTHNNQFLYAGKFFNMLAAHEVIVKNPLLAVKRKSAGDSDQHVPYSAEQRAKIEGYLKEKSPDLLLICQFIYYCFLRPKEITKLQVKHINWQTSRVQVPGAISKNNKQQSVEIPQVFIEQVKNKFLNENPEHYLFGRGLKCNEYMVRPTRYSEPYRKALRELGMDDSHTLYANKHTGAIAFKMAGGEDYALMIQMRHGSIEETRIYLRRLGLQPNSEFSIKQPKF